MSKPVPGLPYTVKKGDALIRIARKAYGDGKKYTIIWEANRATARTNDPNRGFWPGDVINIPRIEPEVDLTEPEVFELPTLSGKEADEFTILIDGTEIITETASATRSIDTGADGWSAVIYWDADNTEGYELTTPYGYQSAEVYLGEELLIRGALYGVRPKISKDRIEKTLTGWTITADYIDSTTKSPYEFKKITLKDIANKTIKPFGLTLVYNFDDTEPFDKVTAGKTETAFGFLSRLARERGALVSSDPLGRVLIQKASTDSEPVGIIEEGLAGFEDMELDFDGRARFNSYQAVAQSPKKASKKAVSRDERIPKSRFTTISADNATEGNLQKAADWERNKRTGESLGFSIPVSSWYAPNGKRWMENTIVTIKSKSLHIPDGFNFLIRSVEYSRTPEGSKAVLSVVPPSVYTTDLIKEPW